MAGSESEVMFYPRCDVCRRSVRVRGVGRVNVWCKVCLSAALPFLGIESEGEYKRALREYSEGLGSRAVDFEGLRFDPFGEEEREVLKKVSGTLKGCMYTEGGNILGRLKTMGGCSCSALFHNIRSARGPALEMLDAERRRWGVNWDIIGLAETWLDAKSERLISIQGYNIICASRARKQGGGRNCL